MNRKTLVSKVMSDSTLLSDGSVRIDQPFTPLPPPPKRIYIQKAKLTKLWKDSSNPPFDFQSDDSGEVFGRWIEELTEMGLVRDWPITPSPTFGGPPRRNLSSQARKVAGADFHHHDSNFQYFSSKLTIWPYK